MVPDQDYMVFGAWLTAPDDAMTGEHRIGVFYDGMRDYGDVATALTGKAKYEGGAAGAYSDSSDSDNPVSGMFTARAVLEADFGDDNDAGMLSGRIDNFANSAGIYLGSDTVRTPNDPATGGENDWVVTLEQQHNRRRRGRRYQYGLRLCRWRGVGRRRVGCQVLRAGYGWHPDGADCAQRRGRTVPGDVRRARRRRCVRRAISGARGQLTGRRESNDLGRPSGRPYFSRPGSRPSNEALSASAPVSQGHDGGRLRNADSRRARGEDRTRIWREWRNTMKSKLIVAAVIVGSFALAGCSGGGGDNGTAETMMPTEEEERIAELEEELEEAQEEAAEAKRLRQEEEEARQTAEQAQREAEEEKART